VTTEVNTKFEIPEEVVTAILKGGLCVVAGRGYGKTNVIKVLVSELIEHDNPQITCKIVDPTLQYRFNFLDMPYIELNKEKENKVYYLEPMEDVIYDIGYSDPEQRRRKITELVLTDFELRRDEMVVNMGATVGWYVHVIEECQNVLRTISGKTGAFWLTYLSEARNYNISYIMTTQRLADVSTKASERMYNYLFGRMVGDNDLRKVKSIANKTVMERVKTLGVGQFLFWNGDAEESRLVNFPLFQPTGTPYKCREKRTLWEKWWCKN
jgi:hypothetical protein